MRIMTSRSLPPVLWLPALLALLAAHPAQDAPKPAPERVGYAWPLGTCVVSSDALGDTMVVRILEDPDDPSIHGREVRFCCPRCVETFEADRARYLKKADEAIEAMELRFYPPIHCVVMPDEALSDPKGPDAKEAKHVVVGNQLVRTCCAQCVRKVKRNPKAWLAKVEKAVMAAQSADYPLRVCPVSGRELPATPSQTLIGGQLVRFCCDGCKAGAERDPAPVLAKLARNRQSPPAK
jgi:YHS domain-containing protein